MQFQKFVFRSVLVSSLATVLPKQALEGLNTGLSKGPEGPSHVHGQCYENPGLLFEG